MFAVAHKIRRDNSLLVPKINKIKQRSNICIYYSKEVSILGFEIGISWSGKWVRFATHPHQKF